MQKKAPRNKTIDFTIEEGQEYLARCLQLGNATVTTPGVAEQQPGNATVTTPGVAEQQPGNATATTPCVAEQPCDATEAPLRAEQLQDRTICADLFTAAPRLPGGFVDLLIADPPYNLTKTYHGNKFHQTDEARYEQFTEQWIAAVKPLLKPNASVYVCCDWKSSLIIGRILMRHFQVQNRITWQREKGRGAERNWKNSMEDIWFVTNSADYTFHVDAVKQRRRVICPYREGGAPKDWEETKDGRFRDTCPGNFWDDISIPYWSMPENTAHPTQKPEKLIAKLILASSSENDIVLDPFAGSGTTAVTAKKLNRHYIGIEQNPLYCAWAEYRLELAERERAIQGYEDGVFWERNSGAEQKAARGKR